MRTLLSVVGGGALSAALATSAIAVGHDTPTYLLSMEMSDGNRLVAKPTLTFKGDEPAQIDVSEQDGSRYSMRVTLSPQADGSVSIASTITVAPAGRAAHRVMPVLRVGLGKPSTFEFGTESPTEKPFRVNFTVDRTGG